MFHSLPNRRVVKHGTQILIMSLLIGLTGCSARQEGTRFTGSTEQRLVTYSINEIADQFQQENLDFLENKSVLFKSHFVINNQVLKFAQQRLEMELQEKYNVGFVTDPHQADFKIDMFFTSLGTDRDSAGFSIPIVNLSDPEQSTIVNLLAIDMYHGVSEGNYYITDLSSDAIIKKGKLSSRVRTDSFATPFFSFPVSGID